MKVVVQIVKLSVILGGLSIALPQDSLADKGGKPNKKSVATTAACLEADGSAHVYSCKALSNVVIWCDGTYIKFDNIGSDPSTGEENEVYDDIFGCGDAGGSIQYVAVKSGSQKHKKHHGDYVAPAGLPEGEPSGSGLFVGNIPSCPLAPAQIPTRGNCDVEAVDPDDPGNVGVPIDPDDPNYPGVPIDPDDPNYPDDPPPLWGN